MTLASRIVAALQGRWYGNYGSVRCPAHDDRSPSLVIRDGETDGTVLVHCYVGCDHKAILTELSRRGLLPERARRGAAHKVSHPAAVRAQAKASAADAHRAAFARRCWDDARTASGTLAQAYLKARGIDLLPRVLRFQGDLLHRPSGTRWPAMIAMVAAQDGAFAGIHRTYLADNPPRKAPVETPKLSLGAITRGAVRLGAATGDLAISEGIETGLAFMQTAKIPTWAALSTSGVRAVRLPPHPFATTVWLVIDRDDAGEAAALAAAQRFAAEGRSVKMARPVSGKDANDALLAARDGR